MSHADEPTTSVPPADPPAPPAPPAPEPPAAPAAPPPAPSNAGDGDRVGKLETMVENLTETVGSLVDAIAGKESDEASPEKLPWTAWGSRKQG